MYRGATSGGPYFPLDEVQEAHYTETLLGEGPVYYVVRPVLSEAADLSSIEVGVVAELAGASDINLAGLNAASCSD